MSTIRTTIDDGQVNALVTRAHDRQSTDRRDTEDGQISRSRIRTWAVLNGDMRPLYTDPEHASQTRWQTIIAPPAALMAFEQITPEVDCLPGSFPVLQAARLEFATPIKLGDTVTANSRILEAKEIDRSPHAGRVVSVRIATEVELQSGVAIGRVLLDWHLYERGTEAHHALFEGRDIHVYQKDDIEALRLEYAQQQDSANHPSPLDAAEGTEVPTVLKGPTTRNRYIPRMGDSWYWGHKQGWNDYRERPELFFMNENQAPEPIMSTDWDHHRAARWGGLPGALEANTDRPHHLVELLMNWLGDSAYPRLLDLQFPKQNLIGDICRSHGRVKEVRRQRDSCILLLDVWQVNQRGETITTGCAEAEIPLE